METKGFSWDRFDSATLTALAQALGYDISRVSAETAADYLARRMVQPTDDFVRRTKEVLQDTWLRSYPDVSRIVERLIDANIGPMGDPITRTQCVDYIGRCRNSPTVRYWLRQHLVAQGCGIPVDDIVGAFVPRFVTIVPAKQPEPPPLYTYQQDAWDQLDLVYGSHDVRFSPILEMPTGSGKTLTAVGWLLKNVVNQGRRVLWIAHRYDLLEQAAMEFYRLARYANNRHEISIRLVSGRHDPATCLSKSDTVMLCSIASLSRNPRAVARQVRDDKVLVVVDEAHHAPARTYRKILNLQRRQMRLGLTATPTRTREVEQSALAAMFSERIRPVEMATLIEKGFLARPIPVRVATSTSVEQSITEEERRLLHRFGDLPETVLDRLACIEKRNQVIVQHYLDNLMSIPCEN